MKKIHVISALFIATCLLIFNSCKTIPEGAIAVKPFDQKKYLGRWYEIARFDYRFERNLNNVTATYSLKEDGTIKVDNKGYDYKKKVWKESVGKAKIAGEKDEAKLKVSFFGPFYSGYNIIAIDKDYKYALIAGQNLDYLWILSREKTIPETIKQDYLNQAKAVGYKIDQLIWVDQTKN